MQTLAVAFETCKGEDDLSKQVNMHPLHAGKEGKTWGAHKFVYTNATTETQKKKKKKGGGLCLMSAHHKDHN